MTEVIKSSMKDETKVKIIKRLCNPKETYIPYYDGNERKPCEPMYSFFCNGWNKCEEKLKCCENCQTVRDVNGNCYLHKDGECDPKTKIKWEAKK